MCALAATAVGLLALLDPWMSFGAWHSLVLSIEFGPDDDGRPAASSLALVCVGCSLLLLVFSSSNSRDPIGRGRDAGRRAARVMAAIAGGICLARLMSIAVVDGLRIDGNRTGLFLDEYFLLDWILLPSQAIATKFNQPASLLGASALLLISIAVWLRGARTVSAGRMGLSCSLALTAVLLTVVSEIGFVLLFEQGEQAAVQPMRLGTRWAIALLAMGCWASWIGALGSSGPFGQRVTPLLYATFALVLGCLLTNLAVGRAIEVQRESHRTGQQRATEHVAQKAVLLAQEPRYILDGVASLFHASRSVERAEFDTFVAESALRDERPVLLEVGFLQRVPVSDLEAFAAAQRADEAPEFAIHPWGESDAGWPTDSRADRWIVAFLVVEGRHNDALLGADFGASSRLRGRIEQAVRSGALELTEATGFEADPQFGRGLLYLVPLYPLRADLSTDSARLAASRGVLFARVHFGALFGERLLTGTGIDHVRLRQEQGLGGVGLLGGPPAYEYPPAEQGEKLAAAMPWNHQRVNFGGTSWVIETAAAALPEDAATLLRLDAAVGVLGSALIAGALFAALSARRRGRELSDLATALSESSERAHRVVDDVSHEFRTPLTVIKECAALLTESAPTGVRDVRFDCLRLIDDSASDLNHLVEDLLDSSKLRVGRLRVDRRAYGFDAIFSRICADFSHRVAARGLTLEVRTPSELPQLFVDEEKARRIISNLLSNAIKFSNAGGTIVLFAEQADAVGRVRIGVSDQGCGISPTEMEGLFRRFQQRATPKDKSFKGFGLGLVIASELCRLNFGSLAVRSEVGVGSTFSFLVPSDSRACIVQCFFDTALARGVSASTLALLRVEIVGEHGGAEEQEVRAFLASVTHPSDLVLQSPERAMGAVEEECEVGEPRAWSLLGYTDSVEGWMARIVKHREEYDARQQPGPAAIRVVLGASWRLPEQAAYAPREAIGMLTEISHAKAYSGHR